MMEENPLPSTTFFHLKQEKKEKIDAVLLEEFLASISVKSRSLPSSKNRTFLEGRFTSTFKT